MLFVIILWQIYYDRYIPYAAAEHMLLLVEQLYGCQYQNMHIVTSSGRLVKGMGHLDHVWSYGVREVVSSIPDRGNIVGWVFHPTQVTGTVSSSEHAFPSKFWFHLENCPRGEAVIIGHLRLSSVR